MSCSTKQLEHPDWFELTTLTPVYRNYVTIHCFIVSTLLSVTRC